ncbi:glycosyltransferase family 4 protein [Nocardia amamiensis]|uniref:glycosyltransferase family 4 protein n=1 Tax=Nocardia amamiensis TaxID=404578 RepID=UPI0012F4DCF7|nr:glycosyltransferase family 4 protein [Nocardia amamiensis]
MLDDVFDWLSSSPDDQVTVDDGLVTRVAGDLGAVTASEIDEVRDTLLKIIEDQSDTPFPMRVGQWSVTTSARNLRSALHSTLLVLGLQAVGATSPVVVLAAIAPFLLDIEKVRFRPEEREVVGEMRADITDATERGEVWARLPEDVRHELPYLRLAELAEVLQRAGALEHAPGSPNPIFQQTLFAPACAEPGERGMSSRPPRVLLVADEWFPAKGGISSLNRYLAFGLAETGSDVYCVVPAARADEFADARRRGVQLVEAPGVPGVAPDAALGMARPLADDLAPDILIGHGRVTGPRAKALRDNFYPSAFLCHFIHMIPDYLEWSKTDREIDAGTRAETRSDLEETLGVGADCVAAVGPMLHEWFSSVLAPYQSPPPLLRFDPGFDSSEDRTRVPSPGRPRILMLGRLGDVKPKGLDIAAAAVGLAMDMAGSGTPGFDLVLRGSPEGQAEELREAVREWSRHTTLRVIVRNYTTEIDRLRNDMLRADLVLMPSRTEAFGLVGLEAIVAGTPLLATDQSGLAMVLTEYLPRELHDRVVVPVVDDIEKDTMRWGHAIAAAMRDRGASFATAEAVRDTMANARSWARACTALVDVWRSAREASS